MQGGGVPDSSKEMILNPLRAELTIVSSERLMDLAINYLALWLSPPASPPVMERLLISEGRCRTDHGSPGCHYTYLHRSGHSFFGLRLDDLSWKRGLGHAPL